MEDNSPLSPEALRELDENLDRILDQREADQRQLAEKIQRGAQAIRQRRVTSSLPDHSISSSTVGKPPRPKS